MGVTVAEAPIGERESGDKRGACKLVSAYIH
jgi:hypothetical protein